eukprot:CAMPEP_0170511106 /NCGR_PEP_ID=MMETSP0208-20121228/66122_1 /TAXON_ID=197538 /ORGANISM="Strombidium inclinatum, Strain S3" /LENGTH=62 /DNA_ID=CAMNT_0010794611 /DNA_START=229 /DNA_END=417 /DNA_ORIENTATION=-
MVDQKRRWPTSFTPTRASVLAAASRAVVTEPGYGLAAGLELALVVVILESLLAARQAAVLVT